MPGNEFMDFVSRRQAAWQRRDPAALSADHTSTATVTSPIFGRIQGRSAIEASYRSLFASFPDWQLTLAEPIGDDSRLAWPFTVVATHVGDFMGLVGSGRKFELDGVLLMRLENGLVEEERRIYDFTGLLLKLGILRARPG